MTNAHINNKDQIYYTKYYLAHFFMIIIFLVICKIYKQFIYTAEKGL